MPSRTLRFVVPQPHTILMNQKHPSGPNNNKQQASLNNSRHLSRRSARATVAPEAARCARSANAGAWPLTSALNRARTANVPSKRKKRRSSLSRSRARNKNEDPLNYFASRCAILVLHVLHTNILGDIQSSEAKSLITLIYINYILYIFKTDKSAKLFNVLL